MTYRILYRDKRGHLLVTHGVKDVDGYSRKIMRKGATAVTARPEIVK